MVFVQNQPFSRGEGMAGVSNVPSYRFPLRKLNWCLLVFSCVSVVFRCFRCFSLFFGVFRCFPRFFWCFGVFRCSPVFSGVLRCSSVFSGCFWFFLFFRSARFSRCCRVVLAVLCCVCALLVPCSSLWLGVPSSLSFFLLDLLFDLHSDCPVWGHIHLSFESFEGEWFGPSHWINQMRWPWDFRL